MASNINDYAAYYQAGDARLSYVNDAILHEGVLWLACDRGGDAAWPVLWRCDYYPDAGGAHVTLGGATFATVDASQAVPVELPADIVMLSAFGVIHEELFAIGSKHTPGKYHFILLKLVSDAWVEAIPYTETGIGGSSIKKLLPAPKGGILAVGNLIYILIKNGATVSSGNGWDAVILRDKIYKTIFTLSHNVQIYTALLESVSTDGITWRGHLGNEFRLATGKCSSIVVFRNLIYGITADYAARKFNLQAFNRVLSVTRDIMQVPITATMMFAFGEAVFLSDFNLNSGARSAIAVSDDAIERGPFPWSIRAEHVSGQTICLLSNILTNGVEVVLGKLGLSTFGVKLEWGTGGGVERPQVEDVELSWGIGDGLNRPAVSSVVLEWAGSIVPPDTGAGDQVLWLTDNNAAQICRKLRVCIAADASLLRCIVRADLEDFDIDAWETYEECGFDDLYTLVRPGYELRIGIIAHAETSPVDINIQFIRDEV